MMSLKLSEFNVFFEYEEKIVGYNGYSDVFILMEKELYMLILKLKDNSIDIGEFSKMHNEFYNDLIRRQFIVNEDIDEYCRVIGVCNEIINDNTYYRLIINSTMDCNFSCWYCYENHVEKSFVNSNVRESIINHIAKITKNNKLKTFRLSWFGGEPLLYLHDVIIPIINKTINIMINTEIELLIDFTTNGYLIDENVVSILKKYPIASLQITLDGDMERHNNVRFTNENNNSYTVIVNNIKLLLKNEISVLVRVNYTSENVKYLTNIADEFDEIENKYKLQFSFQKVWQDNKNESDYLESFLMIYKYFRTKKLKISPSHSVNTLYPCYADRINQATINYNGDVYKCSARKFSSNNKEGVIDRNGIISWNNNYQKRISSKFTNKPCFSCSIFPLCSGGCTTQHIEHENENYCLYEFNEERKKDLVLKKFLEECVYL